jgi:hypothetical protein
VPRLAATVRTRRVEPGPKPVSLAGVGVSLDDDEEVHELSVRKTY